MQSQESPNNLRSFYKSRFDLFLTHLNESRELNEEDLHRLRVDIKNIRSLILLLDGFDLDKHVLTELLHCIRHVFKTSGKLRTIHICKGLLQNTNFEIPLEVYQKLEGNNQCFSERIIEALDAFEEDEFNRKTEQLYEYFDLLSPLQIRQKAKDIIDSEMDIVFKTLALSKGDSNLHDVRKYLKIVKTLLQLLVSLDDREEDKKELEIVNQAETLLGNWHDREDLEGKLVELQNSFTNPEHARLFKHLQGHNHQAKYALTEDFRYIMQAYFRES